MKSPKSGKRLPDDWTDEVLVCPDEACNRLMRAGTIKGKPPCSGSVHRRTGHYPRMDRVVVEVKERPSS